jgi:hypothetical protein
MALCSSAPLRNRNSQTSKVRLTHDMTFKSHDADVDLTLSGRVDEKQKRILSCATSSRSRYHRGSVLDARDVRSEALAGKDTINMC